MHVGGDGMMIVFTMACDLFTSLPVLVSVACMSFFSLFC